MSHEARRTAALPPRREKAHVRRVTEHPDGWFRRFACSVSDAVGSYWAFVAALRSARRSGLLLKMSE